MLKIYHWKKFLSQITKSKSESNLNIQNNDLNEKKIDQQNCNHEWSSEYDYKTYPGSVKIVDSYCLKCKLQAKGSGQ